MKSIMKVRTLDGKHFDSVEKARKHLDRKYDDLLLSLSRKVCILDFSKTAEFIDSNLDNFIKLKEIKNDMMMEVDRED